MTKTFTNMERIIAKIDNDFNPDNSDWIPRVAAWAIDAMAILKVTEFESVTKQYDVKDKIAYANCTFGDIEHVYDENGCEIVELDSNASCCGHFFTGQGNGTRAVVKNDRFIELSKTMAQDDNIRKGMDISIATEITKGSEPIRHRVDTIKYNDNTERNYVLIGKDKMELSIDTSFITVVSKQIKTICSPELGCNLPVVPDNGLLIECIVAWCMYKMLCRGYKHPVFSLNGNSPATNPFVFWLQNKENAKNSVNADSQGDIDTKLWRSAFYIDTFDHMR
ncbi:MAG: putative tail tubular protein [crAssphage sp. isolate ctbg_1]|uniref:Putative tail tubular protein n=1 Tax=crAssphage sp. isolate ctbg_1 TaxID=2989854 RepID=A0A345MT40_9CAUD|nr:MAG: putative tail tubular protein [crAssphage sp. isolate ctbg_1]AXH74540.1 MAG: putative tail tubular protein [crAssphage sp. isolate ctbg_1]